MAETYSVPLSKVVSQFDLKVACQSTDYEKIQITVADVARHVGKCESTVKQLFAKYRESGIMRYYTGLKIKEARRLIREGKYNMTQIADMLHFDNPQYFSKCFKSHTNMTPREYKASILK